MIAVSVSEVFEAQTFSNFFRFPMVFLCGLFIPVQALPIFLQPLSYLAPLTHGVDVLSIAVNHNGHIPLPISFAALVIFSLVLFAVSSVNVKRRWTYQTRSFREFFAANRKFFHSRLFKMSKG